MTCVGQRVRGSPKEGDPEKGVPGERRVFQEQEGGLFQKRSPLGNRRNPREHSPRGSFLRPQRTRPSGKRNPKELGIALRIK